MLIKENPILQKKGTKIKKIYLRNDEIYVVSKYYPNQTKLRPVSVLTYRQKNKETHGKTGAPNETKILKQKLETH